MIPRFITALLAGKAPTVYGDGEQSRDFTYIDNVVEANLLAAKAESISGQMYNVACGERISLNSLLDNLREIIGTDIQASYLGSRPGDVKHSLADIRLAEERLGYRPLIGLAEGLRRTVKYLQSAADTGGAPLGSHTIP